ncbi:MAG: asparagine synthase (glutamine-hydrolyzing) [bacterium]
MCGVTGIFNYREQQPVDRPLAARMKDALLHRGPDDEGAYFLDQAGVYLGHRRLSIIDLAAGQQPMSNEDGTVWIVFNGEIYNFRDLRSELESLGHCFKTRSDTETIIHAYEQWGFAAMARLNGMFGFAIWDESQRALVLARDPFGVKPLYYWDNGHSLAFGSEIKAILHHPAVERTIDFDSLSAFLTLTFVPSPKTAFAGIYKLPPGHALICTVEGVRLRRFYRITPEIAAHRSEEDLSEELRHKIAVAIKRQMVADVPIGAMLSGGVDSSTLATVMTEIAGQPIKTFTVGFAGDFKQNELETARVEAQRIGSQHTDLVVSSKDYLELLPRSIWHLEEPVATGSILAYYMICKLAREQVKVVLTGQGADEPFAGYPRHLGERYGAWYRVLPAVVRHGLVAPIIERLPRKERLKRAVRSLGIADPQKRMLSVYSTIDASLKQRLFRNGYLQRENGAISDAVRLWQSDVVDLDSLSQMLYVDARLSLPDNLLMYGDKMSMAVSLEARVPYLDLELMRFVESIPPGLKIKGRTQKYLLKKAVSKWISDDVINRRKIGFHTPVDDWFQRDLRSDFAERLLAPGSACTTYFRPETIREMLNDHQHRRQDYKRILFSLLTFEIWHDQFIRPARWAPKHEQMVALPLKP